MENETYYQKHKEVMDARSKEWKKKNKEAWNKYQREYKKRRYISKYLREDLPKEA